jgi:Flp pilus assembly protein TadD
VYLSLKRSPAFGVAFGLLVLPLFPILVGIRVFLAGDLVHDRYMYLPSAGLCLFFCLVVGYFSARPKMVRLIAGAAGALVLILFAGLTLAQQNIYRDDESYFRRGLELNPDNTRIIDALGNFYMGSGRMKEALQAFHRAHELQPRDLDVTFQLTMALFNDKQYATVEPYVEELLIHSSDFPPERTQFLLFALGQTDIRLNHLARAEEVLKQLASENDSYPGLHGTLGALYEVQGRIPAAQLEYTREYQLSGDSHSRERSLYLAAAMQRKAAPPPSLPAQVRKAH